jgi:cytochrome c oxidase cbb3-type subunit 3
MPLMSRLCSTLTLLLCCHGAWAAQASDKTPGHRLFDENCAACHGYGGQGGVGVPLALPSFLSSVDDDFLRKTIRSGRPGRIMPAFKRLSNGDVDAIVAYMRGWAGKAAPTLSDTPIPGDVRHGQALFAKNCTACHGEHGEGGPGTGVTMSRPRDLPILAPGLNNPGFLAAAKDSMIKTTLMRGREGTPMESFVKKGLSEKDIDDIVAYVRSFEQTPVPAAAQILETETPTIVRESPYDVAQTVEKVKTAIGAANMRLVRVQYLDQGYVKDGSENKKQVIIYSCDFKFLNTALNVDPRVGLFLPCRITVLEHKGKVLVMAVNPKRLSGIFNNSELNRLCEQMFQIYTNIIEEATL